MTVAALIGAIIPDASLYVLAGWELFVKGTPDSVVFGQMYFSDEWQQIFAIDNSFVLWGLALCAALYFRSAWALAFTGAAILHIAFDFPLHNEDARMHFWPLSDWKFYSPISYWDSSSGGQFVGVIELALVLIMTVYLFRRFRSWFWRGFFGSLAALQVLPFFAWYLFF
ncbi:MAG: cobalamin biosynthesis protein CobQ [Pseudomonadota bacterium]